MGVFTVDCMLATWRDWLRDARVRRMRVAAVATAATPALLARALATPALRRLGLDPSAAFVGRFYSQERLAGWVAARHVEIEAAFGTATVRDR